eukprot:1935255-Rhodomonas_salina.1
MVNKLLFVSIGTLFLMSKVPIASFSSAVLSVTSFACLLLFYAGAAIVAPFSRSFSLTIALSLSTFRYMLLPHYLLEPHSPSLSPSFALSHAAFCSVDAAVVAFPSRSFPLCCAC